MSKFKKVEYQGGNEINGGGPLADFFTGRMFDEDYVGNLINPNQNTVGNPYVLYDISNSVLKIKPTDPGHYTVRMEVEDSGGVKSEFLIRFRVSN